MFKYSVANHLVLIISITASQSNDNCYWLQRCYMVHPQSLSHILMMHQSDCKTFSGSRFPLETGVIMTIASCCPLIPGTRTSLLVFILPCKYKVNPGSLCRNSNVSSFRAAITDDLISKNLNGSRRQKEQRALPTSAIDYTTALLFPLHSPWEIISCRG